MIYLLMIVFVLIGCDKKSTDVRHYTEVVIESPQKEAPFAGRNPHEGLDMSSAPMMPTANVPIEWSVPQGWSQEAGKGMRMATFHLVSNPQEIDCSIVSLGGMAGGLEANLSRWLKQIDIESSDDNMTKLVNAQSSVKTNEGIEAKVFDFNVLQKNAGRSAKSTIAAMVTIKDATVFIKMTGTVDAIEKNKPSFLSLVQSVHSR